MKKKYRNKKWLKKQKEAKGRSHRNIAQECGVDQATIGKWALKFGLRKIPKDKYKDRKYKDKEWLEKQIKQYKKSYRKIGDEIGVSHKTISYWAKKFGIKRYDAQTIIDGKKKCSRCGEWKALAEFKKNRHRSTRLQSRCYKCQLEAGSEWQKQNRDQRNQYFKNKRENDYCFKINRNMSSAIRQSISQKRQTSWLNYVNYDLEDLVQRLEYQFEGGMSWDNHGDWHIDHKKPKSMFDFESPNEQAFRDCWSLANLQPLWASENMSKQDNFQYTRNSLQRS